MLSAFMRKSGGIAPVLAMCAVAISSAAYGQDAAPSREQVELPRPTEAPPPSTVRVDAADAVRATPCPLAEYDIKVRIQRITFTGINGGELKPELRTLLADMTSTSADEQPIAAVCDIRDRANAKLRAAGYVASVQIPPQTIETGELKLEVVTAKIVEVRIRGDAPPYRSTLAARADQLKQLDPLNERDAERILLLASDIPGLDVQLALRPAGTAPGEVIGDLTVIYRRFSVVANAQNYGSRELGRETGYVRGEIYGLTGYSDVTYLGVSSTFDTDEQQVVQFGHLSGLGDNGLAIESSIVYAWSRPDLGQLDLRSETAIGRLALSGPLSRSRVDTANLLGGLEIIEQRTKVFQNDRGTPLNLDEMRIAFLRAEGSIRAPRLGRPDAYSANGYIELRKGLDILGASDERQGPNADGYTLSRPEGDPQAFVVRGEAEGVVAVGPVFSIAGSAFGQWTDQALLNFEEFSLGSLTYGRGYDPGANSADRAIALRGELRAKVYETTRWRAELFGFYDNVWIWNLDANSTEDDRALGSIGIGLRALLRGRAYLEAMYAHPLDVALLIPDAKRAEDRFLVSLTIQFGSGGR